MNIDEFKKLLQEQAKNYKSDDHKLAGYVDEKLQRLEDYCLSRYPTAPGPAKMEAEEPGETAYQRAIYRERKAKLIFKDEKTELVSTWADLELPIVFGKYSRRPPVDLIGLIDNRPFLCEIKYQSTNNHRPDTPLYAIFELVFYYYIAKHWNLGELDCCSVHHEGAIHFRWKKIMKLLIVAANERYWDTYKDRCDTTQLILDFNKKLKIDIHLFRVGEMSNKKPYALNEPNKSWVEV